MTNFLFDCLTLDLGHGRGAGIAIILLWCVFRVSLLQLDDRIIFVFLLRILLFFLYWVSQAIRVLVNFFLESWWGTGVAWLYFGRNALGHCMFARITFYLVYRLFLWFLLLLLPLLFLDFPRFLIFLQLVSFLDLLLIGPLFDYFWVQIEGMLFRRLLFFLHIVNSIFYLVCNILFDI